MFANENLIDQKDGLSLWRRILEYHPSEIASTFSLIAHKR